MTQSRLEKEVRNAVALAIMTGRVWRTDTGSYYDDDDLNISVTGGYVEVHSNPTLGMWYLYFRRDRVGFILTEGSHNPGVAATRLAKAMSKAGIR